jgi:hypothetical protein
MGLLVFLGSFGHPEKIQLLQPSTVQWFRLCDSVCCSEYVHQEIAGIFNAGPLRHSSCRNGALHANFTTKLPLTQIHSNRMLNSNVKWMSSRLGAGLPA